jgi:D-3-phosphoglycerate dehydrogenase / 2-oxoglutarate reductase
MYLLVVCGHFKCRPFSDSLQNVPNVILTPHAGGSTEESQLRIDQFVSAQLYRYLEATDTLLSVNFPQCQLERVPQIHRLAHIHRNIPGMLLAINKVFPDRASTWSVRCWIQKETWDMPEWSPCSP